MAVGQELVGAAVGYAVVASAGVAFAVVAFAGVASVGAMAAALWGRTVAEVGPGEVGCTVVAVLREGTSVVELAVALEARREPMGPEQGLA